MRVPFSYLDRQFADVDAYLEDVRKVVVRGDFTLGPELQEFERRFASLHGLPHAVGVGTGTDAITMALEMLGVQKGDEVITTPNTFIATVGAIAMSGARPVFVDSEDGFVIDPNLIEAAITPRTRAIVPVHYTGNMADMPAIMPIAEKHGLTVVEDAAQAIGASIDGKGPGSWGAAAAFSLHPLKNLNVWSDGGMILSRSSELIDKLRLHRNHGLVNRDESVVFGRNCRFDNIQAVVGNRLIAETDVITSRRIENGARYDAAFAGLAPHLVVPRRRPGVKHVFHLYVVRVERRDELLKFLQDRGVEAKIHYPKPIHLMPAAAYLGYGEGDFPMAEAHGRTALTLPSHQHLTEEEVAYTIATVQEFFNGR